MLIDEFFCLILINIVFFCSFMIRVMKERIAGGLSFKGTSYGRLVFLLLISWFITGGGALLYDFLMPVGFLVFWLSAYFAEALVMELGLYFVVVVCLLCGRGTYSIYCYCLLLVVNTFIAGYLRGIRREKRRGRFALILLTGGANAFLPIIFYYFTFGRLNRSTAVETGIISACLMAFVWLVYPILIDFYDSEEQISYDLLLEDDHPLALEMQRYSDAEYHHARHVARLCRLCAKEAGANEKLCEAAGMYYRLGKIVGRPEIENAIKLATDYCFPPDVIAILEEYEGKERLPQTPESAIVHIVHSIVTRIELMDSETMDSTWNEDMLIYKTLNEFSNTGIYDESGLTMNQFLKIREILVQRKIKEAMATASGGEL